jgi:hypothetical protein
MTYYTSREVTQSAFGGSAKGAKAVVAEGASGSSCFASFVSLRASVIQIP